MQRFNDNANLNLGDFEVKTGLPQSNGFTELYDIQLLEIQNEIQDLLRADENNFLKYALSAHKLTCAENKKVKIHKKVISKISNFGRRFLCTKKVAICDTHINIFWLCENTVRCFYVDVNSSLEQICMQNLLPLRNTWFTYNGKPLNVNVPLCEYGIKNDDSIIQNFRLLGGNSDDEYRLYTHVRDCEYVVLCNRFELQSLNIDDESQVTETLLSSINKTIDSLKSIIPMDHSWMVDMLENFLQIIYWSRKCETKLDYITCVMLGYKLLTGKSVSRSIWSAFDTDDLQADAFTNMTRDARDMFNVASAIIDNPLQKKLRQIYTYLLVQGFLSHSGQDISIQEFISLDAKTKQKSTDKISMIMLIIDTAIDICTRIDGYRLTGDWRSLLHDDATYMTWLKQAEELINLAPFTSNLEAHGTTYFKFVSDLNDVIERGDAICKYSQKTSGAESTLMRKRLNALLLLKNSEITKRASQKERKAPFGVLLHGTSSVGKSSFTKMLYYYYGKVHGLDTDDHYRYVRNPTDEYWSNFDSSKWCIQMDDIAFLLPSKSSDVDATLKEMLNVVNNVPYVPPQAALEDKGKTPVMAKLVIATTNAADLNAHEYFHCPLAVRRRLPFVANIKPKKEYLDKNQKFIDTSKLPKLDGEFPNFWDITVQRLVPIEHFGRDSAKLENHEKFTDVKEFLKYFAKMSVEHENTQSNADACDTQMKNIAVCKLCYSLSTECDCLQSLIVPTFVQSCLVTLSGYVVNVLSDLVISLIATHLYLWCARFYITRAYMAYISRFLNKSAEIKIFSSNNGNYNYKFKVTVKHFLQATVLITQMFLCYKVGQYVMKKTTPKSKPVKKEPRFYPMYDDDSDAMDADTWSEQGNAYGTVESQLEKEETQNVWYNPTLELNKFDVPVPSKSLSTLSREGIRDLFSKNCVRINIVALDADFGMRMGAVFVKGQYMCFNKHAVQRGTRFQIEIISTTPSQGLSSNTTAFVNYRDIKFCENRDIAMVRVANVPPRKDILKFWNTTQIPITQMLSIRRNKDGCVSCTDIYNVTYGENFPVTSLNTSMNVYIGMSTEESKKGDCGSIGVAMTPQGPIIMGLHTLGYKNNVVFPHITREQLENMCSEEAGKVEGEGSGLFSLNGDSVLTEPHFKSLFRYIPTGSANIYGSISGHRAKPRSRVCATPLQSEMCNHFNVNVGYGPPVMSGWEPVYNNVVEMVVPNDNINTDLLKSCVDGFTRDIITGLTNKHGHIWKSELIFLSDRAALNGIPGVKFIDRINVSTSMGFPWNCTKKKFLMADPCDVYPEGVTFEPEVWDRISFIKKEYAAGRRVYPVFTGHLKDEAVSFAKIDSKKTRVFTGAPVDWSIVVRSRLLTFVRLLQKNKFIFEAAPGTVAQSTEWHEFYEHLTQFGEDRLVAGDYKKFDKHMASIFVQSAFQIIANIYVEAGFTSEEVREIYCIGADTAFPLTNVSGDIVEFFGTNPSGHPLTVIVNCIVNSLYLRYAYMMMNPKGESCDDFQEHVHLLTYGDDNIMNISSQIPWFNHTTIQTALSDIGVVYTMAEKDADSIPYINIRDCSFLKRTWRFDEELKVNVCPLEEDSIHKSLTVWVPSQTIDKYKQMVDVITSANNEYFFHGRPIFEHHHKFFKSILELEPYNLYAQEMALPDWDTLITRFWKASSTDNSVN